MIKSLKQLPPWCNQLQCFNPHLRDWTCLMDFCQTNLIHVKSSNEQTPVIQTDPQPMTSTTLSCGTNTEPESQPASSPLLESLPKMSDKIVEAVDNNSRAVRCLETNHLKMAENMSNINRSLEKIGEEMRRENLRREERQKTYQESANKRKPFRPEDRENISSLKSVVNHSYQRR